MWHDTPTAAIAEATEPLEAKGWVTCTTAEGAILEPPPGSKATRRHLELSYSESRDQYRATVTKAPSLVEVPTTPQN